MLSCKRVPLFEKQDPGNEQKRLDVITETHLDFWERGSTDAVLHQDSCNLPLQVSNPPQHSDKVSVRVERSRLPGIDAHDNSVLLQQGALLEQLCAPGKHHWYPQHNWDSAEKTQSKCCVTAQGSWTVAQIQNSNKLCYLKWFSQELNTILQGSNWTLTDFNSFTMFLSRKTSLEPVTPTQLCRNTEQKTTSLKLPVKPQPAECWCGFWGFGNPKVLQGLSEHFCPGTGSLL